MKRKIVKAGQQGWMNVDSHIYIYLQVQSIIRRTQVNTAMPVILIKSVYACWRVSRDASSHVVQATARIVIMPHHVTSGRSVWRIITDVILKYSIKWIVIMYLWDLHGSADN